MFSIADRLPAEVRSRLEAFQEQSAGMPEVSEDAPDTEELFDGGNGGVEAAVQETVPEAEAVSEPSAETETADADAAAKSENDVAAWKGRLKKSQEEAERYRVAAENGSFAAAKLLELQEKHRAVEEELAALRRERESAPVRETGKEAESDTEDEDFSYLSAEFGEETAKRVLRLLARGKSDQGSAAEDVAKLREELREREAREHSVRWFDAVGRDIPEFQGMVSTDAAFADFLKNKRDFSGVSAYEAVGRIGQAMDIERIPLIRALIDEYRAGNTEKVERVASARPMAAAAPVEKTKRKMTAKDRAKLESLRRKPGGRDELLAFLAKFEE